MMQTISPLYTHYDEVTLFEFTISCNSQVIERGHCYVIFIQYKLKKISLLTKFMHLLINHVSPNILGSKYHRLNNTSF